MKSGSSARPTSTFDAVVRSLLLSASALGWLRGMGPLAFEFPVLPVVCLLLLLVWEVSRVAMRRLDTRAARTRGAHDLLAWTLLTITTYLAYGLGLALPPSASGAVALLLFLLVVAAWVLEWPLLLPVWIGASWVAFLVFARPLWDLALLDSVMSQRTAPLLLLAGLAVSGVATLPLVVLVRTVRKEWQHRTTAARAFLSRLLLRIVLVGAVLGPIMIGFAVVATGVAVSEYVAYSADLVNPDPLPSDGSGALLTSTSQALLPGYLLSFTLVCATVLLALQWREGMLRQQVEIEERQRLHQDAHDRVYNRLSALSKRVAIASEGTSAVTSKRLGDIAEDIRTTVFDLQQILGDAPAPETSSDADAVLSQLQRVCEAQASRLGMEVTFRPTGPTPVITPLFGWDLSCIVEEALTNASKHGQAAAASVVLDVDDHRVRLEVTDNGRGMTPTPDIDQLARGSLGLRGMRQRVRKAGGVLDIHSVPGETRITATVPVSAVLSA